MSIGCKKDEVVAEMKKEECTIKQGHTIFQKKIATIELSIVLSSI